MVTKTHDQRYHNQLPKLPKYNSYQVLWCKSCDLVLHGGFNLRLTAEGQWLKQESVWKLTNVLSYFMVSHDKRINRMLEMISNVLTNVRRHVTSRDACMPCHRYTDNLVFWLVQMTLCIMTLSYFMPFVTTEHHFRWSDKRVVDTSIVYKVSTFIQSLIAIQGISLGIATTLHKFWLQKKCWNQSMMFHRLLFFVVNECYKNILAFLSHKESKIYLSWQLNVQRRYPQRKE